MIATLFEEKKVSALASGINKLSEKKNPPNSSNPVIRIVSVYAAFFF